MTEQEFIQLLEMFWNLAETFLKLIIYLIETL
jgi:hypothetical protein